MKHFCLCLLGPVLSFSSASAFALTSAHPAGGAPQFSQPAAGKKKVIDKSCLMICEKWTGDDCSKWVMKCKGDPGYPTGSLLKQ
jgi:hypothetical protein